MSAVERKINRRKFRSFVFVLLLATLSAGCSFFAPAIGNRFSAGDTVIVQAVATDATGIARVEFAVDGLVVGTDAPPRRLQSYSVSEAWQAAEAIHNITVRAINTSGTASEPAAVQIAIAGDRAPAAAPTSPANGLTLIPMAAPQAGTGRSDNAAFVSDVTIPDGTVRAARQSFDKVWRVRNSGTCAWGAGYELVFFQGSSIANTTVIPVPATKPGATVDLRVPMVAPTTLGAQTGFWKLRAPNGSFFGTPVSVTVNVVKGVTPPATPAP